MRHLALRAHMRRWFYAASIALSSAGLGARHAASRDATATNGFVRARLRLHATRLDSHCEQVALFLDNQLWPYAMVGFEKHHATGHLRWVGPRRGSTHWPPPWWTAVALPRATWARSATDTRIDDVSFDLTVELCVGLRSMSLTIELRSRSIRRQSRRVRGSGHGAALRQLYRRWLAPDDNEP
jgi:hypothetical protein